MIGGLALVWMYVFSTNVIFFWRQNNLVKEFPPMRAEAMPVLLCVPLRRHMRARRCCEDEGQEPMAANSASVVAWIL